MLVTGVFGAGCGSAPVVAPTGTSSGATSSGSVDPASSTTSTTTDVGEDSDPGPGAGVIHEPDVGEAGAPCDLWTQDCPPGHKCISALRNGTWDATRCSPIVDEPRAVGEPCVVAGVDDSLVDECEARAMCWHAASGDDSGPVCHALCLGTYASPTCADPCSDCIISDPTLAFCAAPCSPLAQDCGAGQSCVAWVSSFVCTNDISGDLGAASDACARVNACDPGTHCAAASSVPGCDAERCCTPFCDLDAPDTCGALLPGPDCVPFFAPGQGLEQCLVDDRRIGVCALPS